MIRVRIRYNDVAWLNSRLDFSDRLNVAEAVMQQPQNNLQLAVNMHEAVRLAARLQPGRVECLPRSLVLADMLNARSYSAVVKLGVAKNQGTLASHAWVEIDGGMVCEPETVGSDFSKIKRD